MKNSIILLLLTLTTLSFGQTISNAKTIEVAISGNCGMCEKTIENAANIAGEASLDWDKETKQAQLVYDAKKTTPEEVLKRVADVGYDNQYHKADDKAYAALANCCQYTRELKAKSKSCCAGTAKEKSCGDKASKSKSKSAVTKDAKASKSCCASKSESVK